MDPAYWASKRRPLTMTADDNLATYLRNEFPDGASLAWLEADLRDRAREASSGPDRGRRLRSIRAAVLARLLGRNGLKA